MHGINLSQLITFELQTKEVLGNEDNTLASAIGSSEPEVNAEGQALSESEPEAESENAIPEAAAEGRWKNTSIMNINFDYTISNQNIDINSMYI